MEVHIHGRMPYSKELLHYIANGSLAELSITRTHGQWPKKFFNKLINLVQTDSFGPISREAFGLFEVHMDVQNAVPWPNVGEFKMVGVEQKMQGIVLDFESVEYVWKGRHCWTMILITTNRFNTFNHFKLRRCTPMNAVGKVKPADGNVKTEEAEEREEFDANFFVNTIF